VLHEAIIGVESSATTTTNNTHGMQLCLSLAQFMCVEKVFLDMLAGQWDVPQESVTAKAAEIASDKVNVHVVSTSGMSHADLAPTFSALFLQRLLITTVDQTAFAHTWDVNDIFLRNMPPPPGCTQ
jgi:hypothetical protein